MTRPLHTTGSGTLLLTPTPAVATFERDWSPEACAILKRARETSITVVIPAHNAEGTIVATCRSIVEGLARNDGPVDELLVLDGGSTDLTASRARAAGARVVDIEAVLPDLPLRPGKGELMWRSLALVETDIVVWVDPDTRNFEHHVVTNLVAPLLQDPELDYVKAFHRHPLQRADALVPQGGGQVTELLAKPLLASFFPELGGFHQPLTGPCAARTSVMRDLPFFTEHGVEVGLLIDLLFSGGLARMCQAAVGTRVHRSRPLDELSPIAHHLAGAILHRAAQYGRLTRAVPQPVAPADALSEGPALEELERPAITLVQGDWRLPGDRGPCQSSSVFA